MKKEWYLQKKAIVAWHIIAWLIFFSLPYLLRPSIDHDTHSKSQDKQAWEYFGYFTYFILICYFYLNSKVLIPKYVYKKKILIYLTYVLGFFTFMCFSRYLFEKFALKPHDIDIKPIILFEFFIFLFILSVSTAYKTVGDKMILERQNSAKENENLKTELTLLRSQVSPHFMFNVLNNMVSLARKHSDLLEPSLIKLSSLMRYMLYEADEEKVPLHREIEYLQSYIDLQQQRFGKNVAINVSMNVCNENFEIEPMLLIPFVENAFKHGTGMIMDATIDIELKTRDKMLFFSVKNKFDESSSEIKDKTSGIGLTNVKRRLNLLYGNEHLLYITQKEGWFIISLQLNLH